MESSERKLTQNYYLLREEIWSNITCIHDMYLSGHSFSVYIISPAAVDQMF